MVDDPLADDLRALGRALVVEPPPADLATTVLERVAAAVLVTLVLVLVIGSPASARIAEWLGLGGVVVVQAPAPPALPPPAADTGPEIELPLEEAAARVSFALGVPAQLGPPDRVLITPDARVVSMLWAADGDLPELRLDQFAGRVDPIYVKRYVDQVEFLTVAGSDGFWLAAPHRLEYVDHAGAEHAAAARTSGPSLVWQRGGTTLRLEGVPTRQRAMAIALSVR